MLTFLVIPAYNEESTIAGAVGAVAPFGKPIVVDDGSVDGTARIAAAAGATVVSHAHNRGYDAALESGFARAAEMGAEAIITFDADGQHDAGVLPAFVEPLAAGTAELVVGIRERGARPAEALFGWYTRVRYGIPDILCGLKAYRVELYRAHGCFDSSGSIGTELALAALRQGARAVTVPVPTRPRQDATPRLGSATRANLRILRALAIAAASDLLPRRPAGKAYGKEA